jgi:hypothetical protein
LVAELAHVGAEAGEMPKNEFGEIVWSGFGHVRVG